MSGTSKGLKLDSITEDVRARYGPDLRNFDQLANQSLVAGNFAGAAGFFRHLAKSCEQAAEEQNLGWITGVGPDRVTVSLDLGERGAASRGLMVGGAGRKR
jgi:hypothetical protein